MNILFSFRRCPYAMRARMALYVSGISVIVKEIELKNKPLELLQASPKGTVPVLLLEEGSVLDESLEIVQWCLHKNDPKNWLNKRDESLSLIQKNDAEFKKYLDFYKYADRSPERNREEDRSNAENFLIELEAFLTNQLFLTTTHETLADIAIFPFIRQFAMVDLAWFNASPYLQVRTWLNHLMRCEYFTNIMKKDLDKIN